MSLIKCYECGKEISDKAISCPNCGAPTNLDSNKKIHQINKGGFSLKNIYRFLKRINPKNFFWAYPIMFLLMNIINYINSFFASRSFGSTYTDSITGEKVFIPRYESATDYFLDHYTNPIFFILLGVIIMVVHLLWYFNPYLNLLSSKNIKNVIGSVIVSFAYDFSLGGEFGSYFGDGTYYPDAIRIIAMLTITIPITGIIMIFKKDRSNWNSMLMWTTIFCSILSLLNTYNVL